MRVAFGRVRSPESGKLGPLSIHEWGCSRCGREDTSPSRDQPEAVLRERRNCDGMTNPRFDVAGAPQLKGCPWSHVEPEDFAAVADWERWKRLGVWPFPGGGADQPAPVVEAIEICDAESDAIKADIPPPPTKKPAKKGK